MAPWGPWQVFSLRGETSQQEKARAAGYAGTPWPSSTIVTTLTRDTPAPVPAPLTRHLVAGPTMGYRLWPVYTNQQGDLWLGSMGTQAEPWMMGTPTKARCLTQHRPFSSLAIHHNSDAPDEYCVCGLYAVNDPRHLDLYRNPIERTDGICIAIAAGRVSLWGRVYEHEKGYRAQYAYPAVLWPYQTAPMPPNFPRPRRWVETFLRLGEAYGVPVFPVAP